MLDVKSDRKTYFELLKPIYGYEIKKIIATTYSLDMDTLIGLCISLGIDIDIEGNIFENKICMLQALQKMSQKITIICQKGAIKVPKKEAKIYAILEKMVYTINQAKGVFHPKVWFIKYENKKDQKIKYRLIVSSKNLTFDKSWDTQICIEGEKKNEKQKNNSMIHFLEYIKENVEQKEETLETIDEVIKDLENISFETEYLNDFKVEDFEFLQLNGQKPASINFFEEAFIISPFIKEKILNNISNKIENDGKITLITRRNELYKKLLENKKIETFVINEKILNGELYIEGSDEDIYFHDIHAKMFIIKEKDITHLYIGSANATNSAFNNNTEVMVHLTFLNKYEILEKIKEKLLNFESDESYFELAKEEMIDKDESDSEDEKLKEIKKYILGIFTNAKIQTKKEGFYNIQIEFQNYKMENEYNLKIRLLLNNAKIENIQEKVEFKNIDLKDISEFYIIEIYKNNELQDNMIIKIQTENLPKLDERIELIATEIIKNKEDFMQYLTFILNNSYLETIKQFDNDGKSNNQSNIKTSQPALYESLLRALSDKESKIDEIEKLMSYVKNREECIPEKFNELYENLKKAVNLQRNGAKYGREIKGFSEKNG